MQKFKTDKLIFYLMICHINSPTCNQEDDRASKETLIKSTILQSFKRSSFTKDPSKNST